MKLLISPTLLNSFDWYNNCPKSWRERALNEIVATIKRKPKPFSPYAEKGIRLEKAVQAKCERLLASGFPTSSNNDEGSVGFRQLVAACIGGKFQTWCDYFFEDVEGHNVKVVGKIDVLFPGKIIDIKTTGNYKGEASYTKGWQPTVYMLAKNIPVFEFLVAEWANQESDKIKQVHTIVCKKEFPTTKQALEDSLVLHYSLFVQFLRKNSLYEDYVYTYCKNAR